MRPSADIPSFPKILQDFFCVYLLNQKNVSHQTVASYRETFRILLLFIRKHRCTEPSNLALLDLNTDLVLEFLHYLEAERGNRIQTRNARLAAIRSFMKYASLRDPRSLVNAESLLAIPLKRTVTRLVGYLSLDEMKAIMEAPDPSTWSGKRDRVMFATFYNTGARVSEICQLLVCDVDLDRSRSVKLHGKGRKERSIPLWKDTVSQIRQWLSCTDPSNSAPLFPNRRGKPMTRSGIEERLQKATAAATKACPSLTAHVVSPHVLRHTTAMHLLQSGVSESVIALWLGHESVTTTHRYVEADLAMKENALSRLQEPKNNPVRYRPTDSLLSFLETL
jgi:integrase/recombinase XerD